MRGNNQAKRSIKQKKKNNAGKTVFAALVLGLLFITGCGSKAPNVQTMKNNLPSDVTMVEIDSVSIPLKAETIKIEKQQINKKSSTAYCKVECKNDNYSCTKYVTLNYNYYEKGGWILDSWDYYKDLECHALADPFAKEFIISELERQYGRNEIIFVDSSFDPVSETVTYRFDVQLEYQYLTRTGSVTWYAVFENQEGYNWNSMVEDSELISRWDITGDWEWNDPPANSCKLLVKRFNQDSMTAEGYCTFSYDYWDPFMNRWDGHEYTLFSSLIKEYGPTTLVISFGDTVPADIDFARGESKKGTYIVFYENEVIAFYGSRWWNAELKQVEASRASDMEEKEPLNLAEIDNGTIILGNYKGLEVTRSTGEAIEESIKSDLYDIILNTSKIEPKQEAIEANYNNTIVRYTKQAELYNMNFAQFAKEFFGMSEEKVKEEFKHQARAIVERRLIVTEIAQREGININDDDHLKVADQMGYESVDDMIRTAGIFEVDDYILNNKVMDFLVDNAVIR